jgi:hypothetical protein
MSNEPCDIASSYSPWPLPPASPPASPASPPASPASLPAWHSPGAGADASRPDVCGENNHPAFSAEALRCPLLALFDKIGRGLPGDSLSALVDRVLEDARASSDAEMVKDIFVMAFQTRWCRGGKAEKLLFYKFIVHLYERFPNVVLDLVHLIPKYGYWKDLLSLLLECPTRGYGEMHTKVWSLFADQLGSDLLELETALEESRTPKISLCAKYAPSEGGHHSKALRADKEICKIMFHGDVEGHNVRAKYRRMLSRLRTQLHLTETYMCAQRWNEIDFANVPSLCMDRQKYAFLNEKPGGQTMHPDDSERQACREKLLEQLVNGGSLKGNQLFPHVLVDQVVCYAIVLHAPPRDAGANVCYFWQVRQCPSIAASKIIDAQWVAVRNGLLAQVESRKRQLALAAAPIDRAESLEDADAGCHGVAVGLAAGLSRFVPMVDISGSMAGTPMNVAIALGILTSEMAHEAFRDKVLIFAEKPSWVDLSGETTLTGKVHALTKADEGFSTDFYLAMERICTVVRENKLGAAEIPDLLVISDMQFDDSQSAKLCDPWQSSKENIRKIFSDLGVELFGHPFEPPQLIFWNVRSNTVGYAAAADDQGVVMLSGYSPALMKFVLSGELTEGLIADSAGDAVQEKTQWQSTPGKALRKILDDSGLDDVRVALNAMPAASFMCV